MDDEVGIGGAGPPAVLQVRAHPDAYGRAIVEPVGDIDFATRMEFEDVVLSVEDVGSVSIIVDCARVGFVDSSCLHVLIQASHRARAGGWTFMLRNVPSSMMKTLELTGLSSQIVITSSNADEDEDVGHVEHGEIVPG